MTNILLIVILIAILGDILLKYINCTKKEEKPVKEPKMSKEDKKKQERIAKAFENLMQYDEKTASKR